jgi:phage baseplate assembly protein W
MAEDFTDFDCWDDLSLFDRDLTDPVEVLAQDVYHILIEPPGSNIDDPDRGIGIPDLLSAPSDPTLAHRIDSQVQRDDRVSSCQTTISENSPGVLRVDLHIDTSGGAIDLAFQNDAEGFRRV